MLSDLDYYLGLVVLFLGIVSSCFNCRHHHTHADMNKSINSQIMVRKWILFSSLVQFNSSGQITIINFAD